MKTDFKDLKFQEDIEMAAKYSAPEKRLELNNSIKRLIDILTQENVWEFHLFSALYKQVYNEYDALKNDYQENKRENISLLSWRARNLLELSVWCIFCCKDQKNARRFYEDAGRDGIEVFDAFSKWGTFNHQTDDWFQMFDQGKKKITEEANAIGIESLDGRYFDVRKAAEECDVANHYNLYNKLFSKFAHPTALQILARPDKQKDTERMHVFYSLGCLFFVAAAHTLEKKLKNFPSK